MFIIIVYGVILILFAISPLLVKLFLFILNAFITDPIPFVDEFIMLLTFASHMETLEEILEFVEDHPIISILIGIIIIAVLIWLIQWLFF